MERQVNGYRLPRSGHRRPMRAAVAAAERVGLPAGPAPLEGAATPRRSFLAAARAAVAALLMAFGLTLAAAFGLTGPGGSAQAGVVAHIDLSSQRMTVMVNGMPAYSWPVSTARRGYVTPTGSYRPQRMYRSYYSKKYYNSPMPHSIFYSGGYAIHGSYAVGQLGAPASHGCIRLHPSNAATLYGLVQSYGAGNTVIRITR